MVLDVLFEENGLVGGVEMNGSPRQGVIVFIFFRGNDNASRCWRYSA